MENSVLIANCAFFDGQPFTHNVDPCRALGNTFEASFMGGERMTLINNTFYGQGDGLVMATPREGGVCNGSESLCGRNNLFLGDTDYFDPGDRTFLFFQEGCSGLRFDFDYNLYHRVKLNLYTPGARDIAAAPLLAGPLSGQYWGMGLTAASPAIDAGTATGAPITDIAGHPRDAHPDIGAYEWLGGAAPTHAPTPLSTSTPTAVPTNTPAPRPSSTPTATSTATRTSTFTPSRLYLPPEAVICHPREVSTSDTQPRSTNSPIYQPPNCPIHLSLSLRRLS